MGFLRQVYWSGLPFPPPEDLLNPGIEPVSSALAGGFFTTGPSEKTLSILIVLPFLGGHINRIRQYAAFEFRILFCSLCDPFMLFCVSFIHSFEC